MPITVSMCVHSVPFVRRKPLCTLPPFMSHKTFRCDASGSIYRLFPAWAILLLQPTPITFSHVYGRGYTNTCFSTKRKKAKMDSWHMGQAMEGREEKGQTTKGVIESSFRNYPRTMSPACPETSMRKGRFGCRPWTNQVSHSWNACCTTTQATGHDMRGPGTVRGGGHWAQKTALSFHVLLDGAEHAPCPPIHKSTK